MAEPQKSAALPPITARELKPHLILFGLTLLTVFFAGATYARGDALDPYLAELSFIARSLDTLRPENLISGWTFAVPLLSILLAHEFGHYIAARLHRVQASLPYFIPVPFISVLGTAGAVITMRGAIRSRAALLDIGAAGPLAGMVVAVPMLAIGLSLSSVEPIVPSGHEQEGQCLLYSGLKYAVLGSIPDGYDVLLHPTALAGWAGLLVTMLNLLPVGQLDGGHIAYALLGEVQDRVSEVVRYALLGLVAYNLIRFVGPVLLGTSTLDLVTAIGNSSFWLVWFALTTLLKNLSGTEDEPRRPGLRVRHVRARACPQFRPRYRAQRRPSGERRGSGTRKGRGPGERWRVRPRKSRALPPTDAGRHPPVSPGVLDPTRRKIALGCLVLFALLFMPTPLATLN